MIRLTLELRQTVHIAAILLAAGEGRRMGGPKALIRLSQGTFLSRCIDRLSRPGVDVIFIIGGHQAELVQSAMPADRSPHPALRVVVNPRYRDGMLSSIYCGLDAAEAWGANAVLLHPVDHPLVDPKTVDAVVAALVAGARIAVPSHQGRRGHPGGFAQSTWAQVRTAPFDRGARAVLHDHPDWVIHVAGDPGCCIGIDTPEDLRRVAM